MFFALRFSLPYNIGCCSALGLAKRNGSNNSKAEMFWQNRIGIAAPPISSPPSSPALWYLWMDF